MKKILKRNQILITALALMIAVAGYLHFASDADDMEMASNDNESNLSYDITSEDIDVWLEDTDIESLDEDAVITENYISENMLSQTGQNEGVMGEVAEGEGIYEDEYTVDTIPGEAVFTSNGSINTFSGAKLLKEQTRAKNKELLLDIINNANIDEAQKASAINNMIELTDIAEKETAAEILLDAKGFGDAVVSISDTSVDVFVYALELTDAQRAQIEDIVKRKTGVDGSKVVITAVDTE